MEAIYDAIGINTSRFSHFICITFSNRLLHHCLLVDIALLPNHRGSYCMRCLHLLLFSSNLDVVVFIGVQLLPIDKASIG